MKPVTVNFGACLSYMQHRNLIEYADYLNPKLVEYFGTAPKSATHIALRRNLYIPLKSGQSGERSQRAVKRQIYSLNRLLNGIPAHLKIIYVLSPHRSQIQAVQTRSLQLSLAVDQLSICYHYIVVPTCNPWIKTLI